MKLPRPYEIVAVFSVYAALARMRRAEWRQIENFLMRLASQPGLLGDFAAPAEGGRIHQVKVVGPWLISYWPDHAACEVRLTCLEPIE